MKELPCTGHPIIYLDETWVNVNHTKDKVWMCEWPDGDYDVPLKVPLGNGHQFIVLHASSSSGFIPGALLCFQSKSTKDYHEEMDGKIFKNWFSQQLFPNIPRNSIIIVENASYHW